MPCANAALVKGYSNGSEEEEDCVIVAQTGTNITSNRTVEQGNCSIRGDDDVPLVSSSPSPYVVNRMEIVGGGVVGPLPDGGSSSLASSSGCGLLLRYHPDDRSDSGVSSLRSCISSGDERSGSRSSALSSTDEPTSSSSSSSNNGNDVVVVVAAASASSSATAPAQHALRNRSPLYIPAASSASSIQQRHHEGNEPVRVWRDPNLLLEEPHVRHIHSVQHQTLLMSHSNTPASASAGPPPASSVSSVAGHYPVVPASLMTSHVPLAGHHPHLSAGSHALYHHPTAAQFSDMLWKTGQRAHPSYGVPAHVLAAHQAAGGDEGLAVREHLQDRERQERLYRERQNQEMEKQKEKERIERDKQEREKMEREREKREKEEKESLDQAIHNHFEKSLRAFQSKTWNPIGGKASSQGRTPMMAEDERKRAEDMYHRVHMAAVRDNRDHRAYYAVQRPSNAPTKPDYPPPPAHSRLAVSKSSEKIPAAISLHQQMPKSEPNVYGYPSHQVQNSFFEPKIKSEMHKTQTPGGLVVTKSGPMDRDDRVEMKNSVIVKHEVKNPHHADGQASQRGVSVAHSPGPKLRNDMLGHYQNPGAAAKGMYEYRSAAQSPHHLSHAAPPAGQHHHVVEAQNLGKATAAGGHHRSGGGHAAGPLHQHQRRSPHQHQPAHHSQPDVRYRGGADVYQTAAKANYSFTTAGYTISSAPPPAMVNSKPKVSSPAPHQIFGKPHLVSGGGGGAPPPRDRSSHDTASPIPLTSKPPPPLIGASISPSPFQQVSQYHPPHSQQPAVVGCLPPPAHSQTPSSVMDRFERSKPPVGYVPGGLSVKLVAASPPAAAPRSRYSPNAVQCQPLDLGMGSNNRAQSPKRKGPVDAPAPALCLDAKKRKIEAAVQAQAHAQLARVSEPSPLIASAAATAITTVANTLAYRTEEVGATTTPPPAPPPTGSESQSPPCAVDGEPPGTPGKANANVTDSEKSNSPGPQAKASSSGGSYPVRHLKKAWLQRHTGEDAEDTTGVVGSGTCVTLPLNIKSTTPPTSNSNPGKDGGGNPVNSIHSIGSMAVNSINKIKHFANNKANRKKEIVNGDAKNNDDSSSSDQEKGGGGGGGGRKSPAKRKPPKVKRKKGGGSATKKAVDERKQRKSSSSGGPHQATTTTPAASESGTDSDSVASDKDSDSGASGSTPAARKSSLHQQQQQQQQQHRKRGRKPKGGAGGGGGGGAPSKNDKASGDEPRPKKSKDEPPPPQPPRDPFRKPPVGQLKKTGESFLQDGPCFEVAPKLAKCRECRWTPNQRSKNMPNIFCRFYAFRRLRYTKNGQLAIAGFSDPHKDAMEDDIRLWLPNADSPPSDLDLETSRFLLKQVGDHFCDLLVQEKEANAEHLSEDKTVAWKRVVQGVREMCDVCETTLFNFHWACGKCGFVVCIDCYKSRKRGAIKVWGEANKDRDEYSWLLCTNRQVHEQEKLMLTQIIAGDSLNKLGKMVHEMRDLWSIEQFCACPAAKESSPNKNNNQQVRDIVRSILGDKINGAKKEFKDEEDSSSERADIKKEAGGGGGGSSSEDEGNFSTLRELLIRPSHKPNGSRAASPASGPNKTETKKKPGQPTKPADLDDVISSVIEDNVPQKTVETPAEPKNELKHFIRRYNWQGKGRVQLPIRIMTLTESKTLYPNAPHSWLCDGKLLRLSDPSCKENYKIFQDQWKRGQPVIVSDVTRDIDPDLWHPEAFARDFGDDKNDLVNCMTGKVVPNQPMRKFWEGFDHFGKRLKDDRGQPMLLKLKDWPPGEDFAEMLPTRYSDLMKVLPLSEYTHRTGRLNLASRLPECFVRPDLGPKMYNAYGSALHPGKGTTNLHLDISDAVNVMVYVGIPKDADTDEHIKEAFRAIDEAGCDILTRRRVRDKGELPGALWHIYNARDADKIRDLLNKVVVEKGGRLEPHNDPIHDQSCYLDGPLRERLYKEYGVEGYAIVQCKGDAVFIPAGAPHQVRNLHNCIKVAEDFVSPENVSHCFHLTQEFRDLSDTHSNHEDKLQIKNIIYHAVKDALSALSSIINGRLSVKCEKEENCSSSGSVSNGAVGGSGSSNEAEHSAKSDSNEATA